MVVHSPYCALRFKVATLQSAGYDNPFLFFGALAANKGSIVAAKIIIVNNSDNTFLYIVHTQDFYIHRHSGAARIAAPHTHYTIDCVLTISPYSELTGTMLYFTLMKLPCSERFWFSSTEVTRSQTGAIDSLVISKSLL